MREEAGHDGVLLMDRVMSTSLQLAPDLLDLLAVGCVVIAAKQVGARPARAGLVAQVAPATACLVTVAKQARERRLAAQGSGAHHVPPSPLRLPAADMPALLTHRRRRAPPQVDGQAPASPALPPEADVQAASGLPAAAVEQMEWNIRQVLAQVRSRGTCRSALGHRIGTQHWA